MKKNNKPSNISFRHTNLIEPSREYDYYKVPEGFDHINQNSAETGYFVFTMMPSLRCDLSCPHCYLSLEQRRHSHIMTLEELKIAIEKVHQYYIDRDDISVKYISFYWYGGEPTQMGLDYIQNDFKMIEEKFLESEGFYIKHTLLTSLIQIEDYWFEFFKKWCGNYFQTSFDGLMRGKGYMKQWDKRVREARSKGLNVGTITVVNNKILEDTPRALLDYLIELGICEASFLPMMKNEQNEKGHYEKYAPTMDQYSEFMIELMEYWYELKLKGVSVPSIGQSQYITSRLETSENGNIAGQTMFLLPDGEFVLPDYKDGYTEFMQPFGNILKQSFEDVLSSKDRRNYIRKQYLGNKNKECRNCEHKHHCIMEFWKENKINDDCFGAKKYVEWLIKKEKECNILSQSTSVMC